MAATEADIARIITLLGDTGRRIVGVESDGVFYALHADGSLAPASRPATPQGTEHVTACPHHTVDAQLILDPEDGFPSYLAAVRDCDDCSLVHH